MKTEILTIEGGQKDVSSLEGTKKIWERERDNFFYIKRKNRERNKIRKKKGEEERGGERREQTCPA